MKKKILAFACFFVSASALIAAENDSAPAQANRVVIDDDKLIAAVDNLGPTSGGFANEGNSGPTEEDTVNPRVLRDFIESKGLIQCRQKTGLLTIAGDVRARWIAAGEEWDGFKQRGSGTEFAINYYKSEINLYFDYAAPRTWVATKLKFVNFDGLDGGSATRVEMDRAFIGFDIYEKGDEDFYIEIGRSNLDYMYESNVEFSSIFDGIHIFYTNLWPCIGQYTIHGGPFIIDSYSNHYAWVVETYFTNIRDTGFSIKYSIVDWMRRAETLDYGNFSVSPVTGKKPGETFFRNNPRYRFVVSQVLLGYEQELDLPRCKTLFVYGAFLDNFAARPVKQTGYKKQNIAWYTGFTLGELRKGGDWSLDINYQYVQAQAVPEYDLAGMGHGNADNGLLSDAIIAGFPAGEISCFTNYKGLEASFLFALTDTLTLKTRAAYSLPIDKTISGNFHYKGFEMAVIYAF